MPGLPCRSDAATSAGVPFRVVVFGSAPPAKSCLTFARSPFLTAWISSGSDRRCGVCAGEGRIGALRVSSINRYKSKERMVLLTPGHRWGAAQGKGDFVALLRGEIGRMHDLLGRTRI